MILGVDVDGVLAQFEAGFIPLLNEQGLSIPLNYQPMTWNWPAAVGATPAQEHAAWERVKAGDSFWMDLPAMHGVPEFLSYLNAIQDAGHDVYFITNRPGWMAKAQTEAWLGMHGAVQPTVCISARKAKVCDALSVTHYIDDKDENCISVYQSGGVNTCYMFRQPWNTAYSGVVSVTDLKQFETMLTTVINGG